MSTVVKSSGADQLDLLTKTVIEQAATLYNYYMGFQQLRTTLLTGDNPGFE